MRKLFASIDRLINRLVKNYTLWIFIGLLVLGVIAVKAWHMIYPLPPESAVYASIQYLPQGWEENPREKYYQTPQGNLVAPFSWFLALERQPQGFPPRLSEVDLFSSPSVQANYGLLPDNSKYNPHVLPIGIVKDVLADEVIDTLGMGQREWVSISCAACHTGQLLYQGQAVRIDGGQGMWNFTAWSGALVGNLAITTTLPGRFDRFAKRVFKVEGRADTKAARAKLRKDMKRYLNSPLITDALNAILNHTYPNEEGPTRTAALGRGVNGEFGLLDYRNIEQNRGPVSFPPLWHTHDFDWVQSVAAIRQPMGRNITEAWGVNVQIQLDGPQRYLSTARIRDLYWMESLLSTLKSPAWPEDVFGGLNQSRIQRGEYLYKQAVWNRALSPEQEQLPPGGNVAPPNPGRPQTGYCARCHAPVLDTQADSRGNVYIQLPMYRFEVLGTDTWDAVQFNARKPYTGVLADTYDNKPQWPNVAPPLETVTTGVENKWYDDRKVPQRCREIMNGFRPNQFRAPLGYPARPLTGYWATAPYLHNGSVRTLYQLLSPVDQRETSFYVSSFEFDPVQVGYLNKRIDGSFLYDTTVEGNSNAGHEFRDAPKGTPGVIGPYLPPEDRRAIIEYMKWMNDVDESGIIKPEAVQLRKKLLDLMAAEYEGRWGANSYDPADQLYTSGFVAKASDRQTPGGGGMPEFCQKLIALVDADAGTGGTQTYLAAPAQSAPQTDAQVPVAPAPPPPTPGGGSR